MYIFLKKMFVVQILYCKSRSSYSLKHETKSCKLKDILCAVEVIIKVKHI